MKIGFLSSLICYQNAETAWSLYRIFDYRSRLPRYINIARQSIYTSSILCTVCRSRTRCRTPSGPFTACSNILTYNDIPGHISSCSIANWLQHVVVMVRCQYPDTSRSLTLKQSFLPDVQWRGTGYVMKSKCDSRLVR